MLGGHIVASSAIRNAVSFTRHILAQRRRNRHEPQTQAEDHAHLPARTAARRASAARTPARAGATRPPDAARRRRLAAPPIGSSMRSRHLRATRKPHRSVCRSRVGSRDETRDPTDEKRRRVLRHVHANLNIPTERSATRGIEHKRRADRRTDVAARRKVSCPRDQITARLRTPPRRSPRRAGRGGRNSLEDLAAPARPRDAPTEPGHGSQRTACVDPAGTHAASPEERLRG